MKRLWLKFVEIPWCRRFHRKHHTVYWTGFSIHFVRCDRCGCHFTTPRK